MHTTRCDHIQTTDICQRTRCSDIQAAAHSIPTDISKDHRVYTQSLHLACKVSCRDPAVRLPAMYTHQAITRVDPNGNFFCTESSQRLFNQLWFLNCNGTKYHATDTQIQSARDRVHRTQAATKLDSRAELFRNTQDGSKRRMIFRITFVEGAI